MHECGFACALLIMINVELIRLLNNGIKTNGKQNPLTFGSKLATVVEQIVLFGIIELDKAWQVCLLIESKDKKTFEAHTDMINYIGLVKTNMGRFVCFIRLILADNHFLTFWKLLKMNKKYLVKFSHCRVLQYSIINIYIHAMIQSIYIDHTTMIGPF